MHDSFLFNQSSPNLDCVCLTWKWLAYTILELITCYSVLHLYSIIVNKDASTLTSLQLSHAINRYELERAYDVRGLGVPGPFRDALRQA